MTGYIARVSFFAFALLVVGCSGTGGTAQKQAEEHEVKSPSGPAYDIALAEVTAKGDESGVNFHLRIDNRGDEVSDVDWQILCDGMISAAGSISGLALARGDHEEFDQFIDSTPGNHVYVVQLDPDDVFPEADESDNLRTLVIDVAPRPTPPAAGAIDLIFRDPHFRREPDSRRIDFSFSVINNTSSTSSADNVRWAIRMDGADIASGTILSIAAGGESAVTASFMGPRDDTDHTYTFDIDTDNAVSEADGNNNSWTAIIKVPPLDPPATNTSDPDLILLTPDFHGPTSGAGRVTFHFQIKNAAPGGQMVADVHWHLMREGLEVRSGTLSAIQAGAQREVFTWWDEEDEGEPRYVIVVDPDDDVPEANELDNDVELTVWVGPYATG